MATGKTPSWPLEKQHGNWQNKQCLKIHLTKKKTNHDIDILELLCSKADLHSCHESYSKGILNKEIVGYVN